MRTALIDADIIVYKAAAAAQLNLDWDGDGSIASYADFTEACRAANHIVDAWVGVSEAGAPLLVFSDRRKDKASFRYDLLDTYKANRGIRPILHDWVVEYLKGRYEWTDTPDLEGDDVMGILATANVDQYVIVSVDKDMRTLPGVTVCNPDRDPPIDTVSPFQADYNWMFQTLTGDPTDNYKGCPGIGKAKASEVLYGCLTLQSMWEAVAEAYFNQSHKFRWAGKFYANGHPYRPAALALLNARLARILRVDDYDPAEHRVLLWSPTGPGEWMNLGRNR